MRFETLVLAILLSHLAWLPGLARGAPPAVDAGAAPDGALAAAVAPAGDEEQIWNDFVAWQKSQPAVADPFKSYLGKLKNDGLSRAEVKRRLEVLFRYWESPGARPEAAAGWFDEVYEQYSEDLAKAPTALLVEAIKDLKPGTALDAAMGQGRNAVWLAQQKWTVTGYDLSDKALADAQANAKKAGVKIKTVKASHEDFDFGLEKWDLIVLAFAWAPIEDAAFVEKLRRSLRKDGRIVYEFFTEEDQTKAEARNLHKPAPGQAPKHFAGLRLLRHEEPVATGDWGPENANLVRLIVQKK